MKPVGKQHGSPVMQTKLSNASSQVNPVAYNFLSSGEDQWDQFQEKYDPASVLDEVDCKVWSASMEVKVKQAETLIKELTAQSAQRWW
jgi:hypothetical protein